MEDMQSAIQTMANNKAPGASGIPAEALKALPPAALDVLLGLIQRFWTGAQATYEEWQVAILKLLYKGKGDQKEPTNYRGIVLQDAFARLTSIIVTARLSKLLETCGIEEQFGSQSGRGTIDALFCLRLALQLCKEHQLDSYVLFVDLIKAFDTANHELLFQLLEKYGAPPTLVDVVRRLHDEFKLELKLGGKKKALIDYTVGVRQGDNMAPILFLFLIQAMIETYKKDEEAEGHKEPEFRTHKNTASCPGRMLQQPNPARTKGTTFYFGKSIFVDDTAFIHDNRADAQAAAGKLRIHFRRFGLLMHVGEITPDGARTVSKTEVMYFPASPKSPEELSSAKADIVFGHNNQFYLPFADTFKYLGCRIHETLTDEVEITHRLKQAANQAAALGNFFRSTADLHTKRLIFLAIPVNTALYGCESWTLTAALRRSITGFYHKAARRVLGINMHHVEQFHIRNEHVRSRLSIDDPLDIVRRRQFNQLGKFARLPEHRVPRKFIAAWIGRPRCRGRPRTNLRHAHVDALQHILGADVSDNGALRDWLPLAQSRASWDGLGSEWIKRRHAETILAYGHHPFVGEGILIHKYDMYLKTIQNQRLAEQYQTRGREPVTTVSN